MDKLGVTLGFVGLTVAVSSLVIAVAFGKAGPPGEDGVSPDASEVADHILTSSELEGLLGSAIDQRPGQTMPVGTVIGSIVPPAKFRSEFGDSWHLADGSEVDAQDYVDVTNTNRLPDLRGVFLRGINSGREDGDPSGERAPGHRQLWSVGEHKLPSIYSPTGATDRFAPSGGPHWDIRFGNQFSRPVVNAGQESRPTNVAVYYYIRIRDN